MIRKKVKDMEFQTLAVLSEQPKQPIVELDLLWEETLMSPSRHGKPAV